MSHVPHICAEAGLVPCADCGMRQTFRWPWPRSAWYAAIARKPAYCLKNTVVKFEGSIRHDCRIPLLVLHYLAEVTPHHIQISHKGLHKMKFVTRRVDEVPIWFQQQPIRTHPNPIGRHCDTRGLNCSLYLSPAGGRYRGSHAPGRLEQTGGWRRIPAFFMKPWLLLSDENAS